MLWETYLDNFDADKSRKISNIVARIGRAEEERGGVEDIAGDEFESEIGRYVDVASPPGEKRVDQSYESDDKEQHGDDHARDANAEPVACD